MRPMTKAEENAHVVAAIVAAGVLVLGPRKLRGVAGVVYGAMLSRLHGATHAYLHNAATAGGRDHQRYNDAIERHDAVIANTRGTVLDLCRAVASQYRGVEGARSIERIREALGNDG